MKTKEIIITILITIVATALYVVNYIFDDNVITPQKDAYLVYLNNETIGMIENDNELYDLINKEQEAIRYEYNVDDVYPPTGFNLMKINTFDENYTSVNEIYEDIAAIDDFTIQGYIVTIKFPEEENKENITINVLDKEIFTEAMNRLVLSFISEDELNKYLDGERTVTDIGSIISSMYFNEIITIKEGYISVNSKIFTDVESLTQYLLFGPDATMNSYTVELGDNIENISEKFQMNPQEFIIANPEYRDESALLTVGSVVNITYINPVLTFVYEVDQIVENVTPFRTVPKYDDTKEYGYKQITTPGVDGLALDHAMYQVINGEASSEVRVIDEDRVIIREMVEQVVTYGRKYSNTGKPIISSGDWAYPTNYPYYLTSGYGWRSGKMHLGQDISGPGEGSPIYSVDDGVVVETGRRSADGNFVIIQHENNVYTQYAHMLDYSVSVGQTVTRGQKIGRMGHTGLASGSHLHFGVSIGWPYHGEYKFYDPRKYINF